MSLGSQERDSLQSPLTLPGSALNWSVEWKKQKRAAKLKSRGFCDPKTLSMNISVYFSI